MAVIQRGWWDSGGAGGYRRAQEQRDATETGEFKSHMYVLAE
jgi:hypothetical protein